VILRRLIMGLAAAAAFAASAAVMVVALAFALYALAEPYVGRAGAAGLVAGAAALTIALCAIAFLASVRRRRPRAEAVAGNLLERIAGFVREKPVTSVAAALGAGFLAVANPRYLGAAVRSFVEGRPPPKRRR
jgi:chromate transport protein ChrA